MKKKNIILMIGFFLLLISFVISLNRYIFNSPNIDEIEHIIIIKSDNQEIKAFTGSFCYERACIDKINFQDVHYDLLTVSDGDKLTIENLDGSIKSVRLFDYDSGKYNDMIVEYTNAYIIVPSISGQYIFEIGAIYHGKSINYYFMTSIEIKN